MLSLRPPPAEAIPAGFTYFLTSNAGLHWFVRINDDGSKDYACYHDVQPILDHNGNMARHNDGWSTDGRGKIDKTLRRCASVPWGVRYKWKHELGVDYFNPDHQDAVNRLLDDSDYRKLRTAEFRIGKQSQWV